MYQGRIVDILDPEEATPERLGLLMGGAHPEEGVVPSEAAEMARPAAGARPMTDRAGATPCRPAADATRPGPAPPPTLRVRRAVAPARERLAVSWSSRSWRC